MTTSELLTRFQNVRQVAGGWSARCPAHDDTRASLSIKTGDDGRTLVHCHAGCTLDAVLDKVGLRPRDLFADDGKGKAPTSKKGRATKPCIFATPKGLIRYVAAQLTKEYGEGVRFVRAWQYDGFRVLRFDLPTPASEKQRKEFRPCHQVPLGTEGAMGWTMGYPKPDKNRPLYQRAEVSAAVDASLATVHGGEKAADAAIALGLLATTNVGGEAAVDKTDWSPLSRFAVVVIVIDNDPAGEAFGRAVAVKLKTQNPDQVVKIVCLPGLPPKGDIVEWTAAGGTKEEFLRIVAAMSEVTAEQVAEWNKTDRKKQPKPATEPKKPEPPPYVPFPTDVLPKVAAEFIHEGAAALGCDESYVALPLLAACAAAVGNTRRIRLKRDWCEPCILWAVIVGDSGTLKSPALDLALAPIREVQNTAFREHKEAMEQYQTDKATFDADLAEWKKKGRKNGEPPPEEPEEPVAIRYVANDTTVEALAVLLEEQPRGLLVAHDELSAWINSFDAYKACRGKDVAQWLSMHRAGVLTVDRKGGRRIIHVPRAAVCIAGGIQPKALAASLVGRYHATEGDANMDKPAREHFDNGLCARLLVTMPPRLPKRWTEDSIADGTEAAMEEVFRRLLDLQFDPDEQEPAPVDLTLTREGKAAWVRFYNEHAREQVDLSGDLAAAWSKLEGYAARFALLLHLIRAESGDATLVNLAAVDETSIAAGVTLSRWFGDEAARVYAIIGGDTESPEAREQRNLLRIMRDRGGEITVRGLMQASRRYRSSAEEAEAALGRLVVAEIADVWEDKHDSQGGRPVVVFTLRDSGNGNTTSEISEKNGVVLPLPPPKESESEMTEWTG